MALTELPPDNPITSYLTLEDIEVFLHLGCSHNERRTTQRVHVSVHFRFGAPPAGCQTDRLSDTLCYAAVTKAVVHLSTQKEFHLIEHFAQECFQALRKTARAVQEDVKLKITIHKIRPPVNELKGGATFTLGEF